MVSRNYIFTVPLIGFLWMLVFSVLHVTEAQIGVCYGTLGNNLPHPEEVITDLYVKNNIQRMRLYDPYNKFILQALSDTNIEVMLGLPNKDLQHIASSQENADSWVYENIRSYTGIKFRYISVGNEVNPLGNRSKFVLPAMEKIQNTINQAGLANQIKVSTTVELSVTMDTYPPENGKFNHTYQVYLNPIIEFLQNHGSPLLVSVYPYYALAMDNSIPLDYALFTSPTSNNDQNLFFAMIDATYSALVKAGAGSVEIVVSETGWPTEGGYRTTIENANTYDTHLIQKVKEGSPKRRGRPIKTYIFSLFDENEKEGDVKEKHWGLFFPNKTAKYHIDFN